MMASIIEVDFSKVPSITQRPSKKNAKSVDNRPTTPDGVLLSPKQIRARARRRFKRGMSNRQGAITKQEFNALYKPVEEWDLEELAKGRPRNSNGQFSGRAPEWITREVYEQAMSRFTEVIKGKMGEQGITALETIHGVLTNEDVDHRGKLLIPASTKVQASMFLLEHIVGKPKQHVTQDISVKLQGILGSVMVNPNQALAPPDQGGDFGDPESNLPGYEVAHLPGHTIPIGAEDFIEGEVLDDE